MWQSGSARLTKPGRVESPQEAAAAQAEAAAEPSIGYAAEHAALAFGIPRVAPVPIAAGTPPGTLREPTGAATPPAAAEQRLGPAGLRREDPLASRSRAATQLLSARPGSPGEDLTESLTADPEEAAVVAALHASAAPAGGGTAAVSDQVTAVLTVPKGRPAPPGFVAAGSRARPPQAGEPLSEEPEPQPQPEPQLELHRRTTGPLQTAALPVLRGSPESATTTWTLPAATERTAVSCGRRATRRPALVFAAGLAGAALGAAISLLAVRALPPADHRPGSRGPAAARRSDASAERLIEQAVTALRAGQAEQAAALLLRYQASRPAAEPEPAVEIMLRLLRREAAAGSVR